MGLVFVPLAEEVLYRGVIRRRLARTLGRWPAIILACLAFPSVHLLNFSVVIGYVYERTSSLGVAVFVHAIYNACVFGFGL